MNLTFPLPPSAMAVLLAAALTPGAAPQAQDGPPPPLAAQTDPVVACNTVTPRPRVEHTRFPASLRTSGLPCEVMVADEANLTLEDIAFDFNAWLTFIALNSPAGGKTPIGGGTGPGGDAPAQWEQWQDAFDLQHFRTAAGAEPLPPACAAASAKLGAKPGAKPGAKLLRMVGKNPTVLGAVIQAFDSGPLTDQNGRFTRYEILVNGPMAGYITQNNLDSKQGQAAFAAPVDFPAGIVGGPGTTRAGQGRVGSIMVKAAWKPLGKGDDPKTFHTADALLHTPPSPPGATPVVRESCEAAKVGLVGLHIAHKTRARPQWVWATFEHAANVPSAMEAAAGPAALRGRRYNFFNPACDPQTCPPNQPPPRPWNPNLEPLAHRSQITRLDEPSTAVKALNRKFAGPQGLLAGTVWQHYMLVGTQWPTQPNSKADLGGVPTPAFLANTTAESYIQGRVPQSSSSCVACHNNAAASTGARSDFTYILERAK